MVARWDTRVWSGWDGGRALVEGEQRLRGVFFRERESVCVCVGRVVRSVGARRKGEIRSAGKAEI